MKSLIESIKEKQEEQSQLLNVLPRSIAVRELWKDVFDFGPVKATYIRSRLDNYWYQIENGKGEIRKYSLSEVDLIIKPTIDEKKFLVGIKHNFSNILINKKYESLIKREKKNEL